MKNKLEEINTKYVSKSSAVTIQVEEKGTNTKLVNIRTQEDDNIVKRKTYSELAVQMMKNPSENFVTNSTTSDSEVN